MKTFAITFETNYGEVVRLVNAPGLEEARSLADHHGAIWGGYTVELIDTKTYGFVFTGGGM